MGFSSFGFSVLVLLVWVHALCGRSIYFGVVADFKIFICSLLLLVWTCHKSFYLYLELLVLFLVQLAIRMRFFLQMCGLACLFLVYYSVRERWFSSISMVNLIFGCLLLGWVRNLSSSCFPWLQITNITTTYFAQMVGFTCANSIAWDGNGAASIGLYRCSLYAK